jgi:iron complex outermembrane receptor protein
MDAAGLSRCRCGLSVAAALVMWSGVAAQEAPADSEPKSAEEELVQVVATGTLLRRNQADIATPVVSVDQDQIQKSGALNVGDLVRYIPQNIGSAGGVQDLAKGGPDGHDARSVNLRGLGAGATLVLMNGRRVVASEGFVNLNSLVPSIAISRLETSLGGASAIYGADAVAGVVNVITNNHFQGFDATAQYTSLDSANDYQAQAMFGAGGEKFHVVGSFGYTSIGRLQNADRDVTNFFNGSSGTGANPGTFTMSARPRTATGGDVIIGGRNYSTLYDQLKNAQGILTIVDPNCGSAETQSIYTPAANAPGFGPGTCTFSFQAQNPLRPGSESILTHLDGSYDLTEDREIYMELAGYHQDSSRFGVPSFAQNHNAGALPTMPASSPYNPFGVPVGFTGRAIGSQGFAGILYKIQRDELNQVHSVLGSRGTLFKDWQYDVNGTWSRSSIYIKDKDTDMNLFQAALNGYGGPNCNYRWNGPGPGAVAGQGNCEYLSPFAKDNQSQPEDLIFNIQSDVTTNQVREYLVGEAVVNGTAFELPTGQVQLALGAQTRREMQKQAFSDLALSGFGGFSGPSRNTLGSRTVRSFFAETDIPLIARLSLDIAARHEDYGAFTNTSPKAELNWKAIPQRLALRASYGKSFQAPGVENATASQIATGTGQIFDPVSGTTTFRTIVTLGNPDLQPQTAKAYNFGLTLNPLERTSVSVDLWNYKYDNRIQTQNAQAVINADPNGPSVIRDSNGVAQTVITRTFNAPSGTRTSGVDLTGAYSLDLLGGQFTVRNTASYLLKYDIDTGSVIYDGIGRRNASTTSPATAAAAPRVRNMLSSDWSRGGHSLNVSWRYSSSVEDDYNLAVTAPPSPSIKAWSVVDWQYRLMLGSKAGYEATIGMINAFDTEPGAARFTGYLPSVSDALGRQTYVRLGARF